MLGAFGGDTSGAVAGSHGQVVTMIGDGVLLVTDEPADAAEITLRPTSRRPGRPGVPALRAAMAAGRVLTRFGDVCGPVVNWAGRLTSLARPGTALVEAGLAAALHRLQRLAAAP